MALRIDLRVPPCAPAPEVAALVRQAEDAGFDGVGLTDSQLRRRDIFVSMALAVQATSRIRVAAAVTNPVTRHASVLASAAQTVAEMAPGRVEIWIGRGDTAVYTVGLAPASMPQMRESILKLKHLLTGESVSFDGTSGRMAHGGGAHVPIYLAANGPKGIELAGEVADGLVLRTALHPKALEVARRLVAEGARRAGRDPGEVDVILTAITVIRDDLQEAREMARPICVQWLLWDSTVRWLREAGIDPGHLDMPKELWELYPDLQHADDWEKAKRLCAFLPQETLAQICDAIGFIGTPEHCARRLQEAHASGMDHFYVMPGATPGFPLPELRAFRESIFPAVASLR